LIQTEQGFGVNWDGEYEALDRLILGVGTGFSEAAALVLPAERLPEVQRQIIGHLYEHLVMAAMPIQDAIDLARFLVETTAGFVRFSLPKQPKTVRGPVEIAAITKHEGLRWVQRRHFFSGSLTPPLELQRDNRPLD